MQNASSSFSSASTDPSADPSDAQEGKARVDLQPILDGWDYEDDAGLQARKVLREDGSSFIQIRVELGVLQLEMEGRPDGTRPHGFPSLLDHYRAEAEAHRRRTGWYEEFELTPRDCSRLRSECLQYYHRRIAHRTLREHLAAVADADHNLAILDLIKAFAKDLEDQQATEQFRPFILAHRFECLALHCMEHEDGRGALLEIDRGMARIREAFAAQERPSEAETSVELGILAGLRRKLMKRRQNSSRHRLQILLDEALRREDPDRAADLRAQLRSLEQGD